MGKDTSDMQGLRFNIIVRFHSFCPPEEPWGQQTRLGIYFHIELAVHGKPGNLIGNGEQLTNLFMKKATELIKEYGNHPSILPDGVWNEPAGISKRSILGNF